MSERTLKSIYKDIEKLQIELVEYTRDKMVEKVQEYYSEIMFDVANEKADKYIFEDDVYKLAKAAQLIFDANDMLDQVCAEEYMRGTIDTASPKPEPPPNVIIKEGDMRKLPRKDK